MVAKTLLFIAHMAITIQSFIHVHAHTSNELDATAVDQNSPSSSTLIEDPYTTTETTSQSIGNKNNLQNQSENRKAYVTLITADREVDKSLVMLASLFAMTKTKATVKEKDGTSTSNSGDNGQCTMDNNAFVKCDYYDHDHDYICLVIPKQNNKNFEHDTLLKKFNLGVSHSNIQKLIWAGCNVKPIPYSIYNPNYDVEYEEEQKSKKDEIQDMIWSNVNYNQVWIWSLKPHYDTVVYIDSNHLVLSNMNHLFNLPSKKEEAGPFIAAPHDHLVPNQFHSGLMVIEPDTAIFQQMLSLIKTGDVGYNAVRGDKNEEEWNMGHMHNVQEFLNAKVFPNWYSMSSKHRLESSYNTPFEWTLQEYLWLTRRNKVVVFHFTRFHQPEAIIQNPEKYRISKYAAPIVYLWTLLMFFVTAPLVNLEEETRYVLHEVFRITDNSEDVVAYIERMKRGGTRRRLALR